MKGLTYAENELLEMLSQQDRKAFNYLYDNYSEALYGILIKIVQEEDVAQDLLQDTFVKIWKKISHYDSSKGRLFTWMLNIARNCAIDFLRARRPEMIEIEKAATSIEERQAIFGLMDSHELRELVSTLKTEHRLLIEMVYWGGYTHEETAKKLQLPLTTVKTRIRTAIIKLRGCLMQTPSFGSNAVVLYFPNSSLSA